MKKTKFFIEESIEKLELSVNAWLSDNKTIGIIRTDMQAASLSARTCFSFYILYEAIEETDTRSVSEQVENIMPAVDHEKMITPEQGDIQLQ